MAIRSSFSKKRRRVMQRDRNTCKSCGENRRSELTIDHKIPRSRGGSNDKRNLQVLCRRCNHAKGDRLPYVEI